MEKQLEQRKIIVNFRVTQTEKKELLMKAEQAHMSLSSYIVALSSNKKIVVTEKIPELLLEITRIGTNVNQIAHICNSQRYAKTEQLQEVLKSLGEVKSIMNKILQEIYSDDETVIAKRTDKRTETMDKKLDTILQLLTEDK